MSFRKETLLPPIRQLSGLSLSTRDIQRHKTGRNPLSDDIQNTAEPSERNSGHGPRREFHLSGVLSCDHHSSLTTETCEDSRSPFRWKIPSTIDETADTPAETRFPPRWKIPSTIDKATEMPPESRSPSRWKIPSTIDENMESEVESRPTLTEYNSNSTQLRQAIPVLPEEETELFTCPHTLRLSRRSKIVDRHSSTAAPRRGSLGGNPLTLDSAPALSSSGGYSAPPVEGHGESDGTVEDVEEDGSESTLASCEDDAGVGAAGNSGSVGESGDGGEGRKRTLLFRMRHVIPIVRIARPFSTKSSHGGGKAQVSPEPETVMVGVATDRAADGAVGGAPGSVGDKPAARPHAVTAKQRMKRAVRRVNIAKGFGGETVLERLKAERDRGMCGSSAVLESLSALLAGERSTVELAQLSFDPERLRAEVEKAKRARAQERRSGGSAAARRAAAREAMQAGGSFSDSVRQFIADQQQQRVKERDEERRLLGFGMTHEAFLRSAEVVHSKTQMNQLVVARLVETLSELDAAGPADAGWLLRRLDRLYTCIHPDSAVVGTWTLLFFLLILYLATAGLFLASFGQTAEVCTDANETYFTPIQWFDAAVDLFFITDIVLRLHLYFQSIEKLHRGFVFGIAIEGGRKTAASADGLTDADDGRRILRSPSQVLIHYCRTELFIDALSSIPIQWIVMVMARYACSSAEDGYTDSSDNSSLLAARTVRLLRVTRVVAKVVRARRSRAVARVWRKISRRVDNAGLLNSIVLVAGIWILNHFWTCLSWLIQSLDTPDAFNAWKESINIVGNNTDAARNYVIAFSCSLQNIFAIQPYAADSIGEGIFSVITTCLAVVVSATILSTILDIWQSANRGAIEKARRMTAVMQYLRSNGVEGALRDRVLDYCDFHYGDEFAEFERSFLDELPVDLQAQLIERVMPRRLDQTSSLFRGASESFVARLMIRMARRPFRAMPGQCIVAQGTYGDEMYLLKSGAVEISVRDPRTNKVCHAGLLKSGACFGEVSLLVDTKRMATCRAVDYCELYTLTRADLEELLDRFPENRFSVAASALAPLLRSDAVCPALRGITEDDGERLARRMAQQPVEIIDGAVLCDSRTGKPPSSAYLIKSGQVTAEGPDETPEPILDMEDLRCVGLSELLAGVAPLFTVRARGTVLAYRLGRADLPRVFPSAVPAAALALRRFMAQAEAHCARERATLHASRWAEFASAVVAVAEAAATGQDISSLGRRGYELSSAAAARRRRSSVMMALGVGGMSLAESSASAASDRQK